MRLSLIHFIKVTSIRLRIHKLLSPLSSFFSNIFYLVKLSEWAAQQGNIPFNDFPSKWDYTKRFLLYNWVADQEKLKDCPINYLEFGVADGYSIKWFVKQNGNPDSIFHGFDTFTGLPEDFGSLKKGDFDTNNKVPEIDDRRVRFHTGLFQQTLPGVLPDLALQTRNVVMLDADLYSSTLYVLTTLAPYLKKDDIIFFDEFLVPTHEFKAYHDFSQAFPLKMKLIGAANNYYFSAFKVE